MIIIHPVTFRSGGVSSAWCCRLKYSFIKNKCAYQHCCKERARLKVSLSTIDYVGAESFHTLEFCTSSNCSFMRILAVLLSQFLPLIIVKIIGLNSPYLSRPFFLFLSKRAVVTQSDFAMSRSAVVDLLETTLFVSLEPIIDTTLQLFKQL